MVDIHVYTVVIYIAIDTWRVMPVTLGWNHVKTLCDTDVVAN